MPMPAKNWTKRTMRIDPIVWEEIKRHPKRNMPMSDIITMMLREYLQRLNEKGARNETKS